jgi:polysaccharide export outer membrane protein
MSHIQAPSRSSFSRYGWHPWRRVTPRTALLILLAIGLTSPTAVRAAEYRLNAGDVLEISVARIPELSRRVPVQLDGTISYPLLGSISVAGLTRSQAEAKIRAGLTAKVYQAPPSNGRSSDIAIEADEVTATVVEYGPIYVNGDVGRPGAFPYRPFMTVRQAVALSGGYDTMRFRTTNPILEGADLKSEYESLWTEFAKEQAHVWRVRAEMADKGDAGPANLSNVPLPRSQLAQISQVEKDALDARQTDHQREKTFLQRTIKQGNDQIAILSEQQKKEEKGTEADVEELQKALDLYSKGTLTSPRVTDARRAVLLSSTRALQTTSQLMQLKRQQDEAGRRLERLDDERRIKLLAELQDGQVRLEEIRAKLQGVGDKLQYTGLLRSRLDRGPAGKPVLTLVRRNGDSRQAIEASEDTELQPGDVVEVSLKPAETSDVATR